MEDENFVPAYACNYGYPHPYRSAACPTLLAKNHTGKLSLDGGNPNGDHGVFAAQESPGTEG